MDDKYNQLTNIIKIAYYIDIYQREVEFLSSF